MTGRGHGQPPIVSDELGAESGCATMNSRATDIIIARPEALYLEHVDGRGPSFAVEGPKTSILSHKGYAVIVSPPITPSAFSGSATVRKRAVEGVKNDVTRILVFDMDNRFVAFSDTFREEIKTVFACWGILYVLTTKSTVCKFISCPESVLTLSSYTASTRRRHPLSSIPFLLEHIIHWPFP